MTKVLLYSGGIDSYCANYLWKPDIKLYCKLGHRYQDNELKSIFNQGIHVSIDDRLYLGDMERTDAIIPLRNLFLIMIASYYGDEIGLGALKGEVNPDKSDKFRVESEKVLNTCYAPSYWSNRPSLSVVYPVSQYSKTELIREYLNNGGDGDNLVTNTRSCYSDHPKPCGHCSACVKRYIALTLNGLSESYMNNPGTSPYLSTIRERWTTYDSQRQSEILTVFPKLFNG